MFLRVLIAAFLVCFVNAYDEIACEETRPRYLWTNQSEPGVITSPYWNDSYVENSLCEWSISTDEGEIIELFFIDFELETCTDCRCDALEVYDGVDDTADLLGVYCDDASRPDTVLSTGNAMFVRFRSDEIYNYRGFAARYGFEMDTSACSAADRPLVITGESGFFTSPNFPANYPDNSICLWHFDAPEGQNYRITFYEFETEHSCSYDVVNVYDGPDRDSPRVGRYWGLNDLPPDMISSEGQLYVEFISDASVNFPGFMAYYELVDD